MCPQNKQLTPIYCSANFKIEHVHTVKFVGTVESVSSWQAVMQISSHSCTCSYNYHGTQDTVANEWIEQTPADMGMKDGDTVNIQFTKVGCITMDLKTSSLIINMRASSLVSLILENQTKLGGKECPHPSCPRSFVGNNIDNRRS